MFMKFYPYRTYHHLRTADINNKIKRHNLITTPVPFYRSYASLFAIEFK